MEWLKMWDEKANTENYFTQTGRGKSFGLYEFLLYIQDVQNALQLCKDDSLLDIGGGPGWVAMHLSPFTGFIVSFDYSIELVIKAKKQITEFKNIIVFHDDILKMEHVKPVHNKVLVGSVLQYLTNMDEVKTALQNIYNVMKPGGIALFTHNPDLRKRPFHLAAVPPESMEMETQRLWLDPDEVYDVAIGIGFRTCRILPINSLIWQSGHMFDMVLTK
jgi:SAM-dependent methyltransferase